METPLRAIEMSDSSSLGINPALAAEVCDVHSPVSACISASSFVSVCILMHLGKKILSLMSGVLLENRTVTFLLRNMQFVPKTVVAAVNSQFLSDYKLLVLIYSTFQH